MGTELFDQLGLDPDDPRTQAALEDARAAERLIDSLVQLRLQIGATQTDVAEEMETTQSAVSKFERAGGDPHLSTLQRYARAVGARLWLRAVVEQNDKPSWQADYVVASTSEALAEENEPAAVVVPIKTPIKRLAS